MKYAWCEREQRRMAARVCEARRCTCPVTENDPEYSRPGSISLPETDPNAEDRAYDDNRERIF